MRIAVSSETNNLKGNIDPRFGRCKYFCFIDVEDGNILKTEFFANEAAEQGHGAGLSAAQFVAESGAEFIITGDVGPKAQDALKKLGITVYSAKGTLEEGVRRFIGGEKQDESDLPTEIPASERGNGDIIFFPLLENNGLGSRISDHFGHAPYFGAYDVEKKELRIIENRLDHHNPNISPIDQIERTVNPTIIFAKGIGRKAINFIQQKGMGLKTGNFDTVDEVIANLDSLFDQTEGCGHEHH